MKLGFFEIEGWEKDIISERFAGETISFFEQKLDLDNLPPETDFEIISIFVNSKITSEVLKHFPNLKFITTRSTGFDHINSNACKEAGVAVSYAPGYGDNTVAEFAFGLILNLTRKMYHCIDRIKESGSFSLEGLRGVDIKGKILGVVGTGRIGKEVIKIAKGFGMSVIAFDPYPDNNFQKEAGFEYLSLEEVLKKSDIVTLHCPYLKSTHHLINKQNIMTMKKGSYIINTARGAIVETEALVQALQQGILAGVGLDVLEEEGEVKDELNILADGHPNEATLKNMLYDHILMEMPNVLVTPHNAFNTGEALERILNTTIQNIEGFSLGKPINLIPEN